MWHVCQFHLLQGIFTSILASLRVFVFQFGAGMERTGRRHSLLADGQTDGQTHNAAYYNGRVHGARQKSNA